MSRDINSEEFDWNDYFFENDIPLPRVESGVIEMIEVGNNRWVSLNTLPKIVSQTTLKKPGITPSSPRWDTGTLRKSLKPTATLVSGEVHEVPASPIPASFEAALADCGSEYHM